MRRGVMIILFSLFCLNGVVYAGGDLTVGGNLIANIGVRDSSRGLTISCASSASLTVNAAEVILEDATGVAKRFTVTNKTAVPTFVGAGGLDTGTEAANSWYYIWLVGASDGTVNTLLSLSSTSPVMPTSYAYTYNALVGAVYNDSTPNFVQFDQRGNRVVYTTIRTIINGTTTTSAWTPISVTHYFPPTARNIKVAMGSTGGAFGLSPYATGAGGEYRRHTPQAAGTDFNLFPTNRYDWETLVIPYEDTIYYFLGNTPSTIAPIGWEY